MPVNHPKILVPMGPFAEVNPALRTWRADEEKMSAASLLNSILKTVKSTTYIVEDFNSLIYHGIPHHSCFSTYNWQESFKSRWFPIRNHKLASIKITKAHFDSTNSCYDKMALVNSGSGGHRLNEDPIPSCSWIKQYQTMSSLLNNAPRAKGQGSQTAPISAI